LDGSSTGRKVIELDYIDAISAMSVQRILKKRISPSPKEVLENPTENCSAFVAAMEHLLEVYHRPYNENMPVICMDESNKQLVSEGKSPILCEPGTPLKVMISLSGKVPQMFSWLSNL
jgi:hypothetical protein